MPSHRVVLMTLAVPALVAAGAAVAAAEQPAKIFETRCVPCHGREGKPSPVFAKQGVRDFTDRAWQKVTSDVQIEKTIRDGKRGTMMAAFGNQLSAEEIKGLVGHIRTLGAKK